MTVKELKQELDRYPDEMDVFMTSVEDFEFAPLARLYPQNINFKEDFDGKTLATVKCLVLDESE